ncbi:MAG: hypothetical protein SFW67_01675 [Myxococcaceae bacterium]|nr:hypothetical protein [Myxococcaceae bacterium]
MKRAGRIGLVAALWGATTALAGAPVLTGAYQVNELGLLDFKTDGDKVSATWVIGGKCSFTPSEVIVEGTLEGAVLIGVLKTCAEPPSCGQLVRIPFLGVFSGGTFTAFIEPPAGCSTPGVQSPLTFVPTNATRLLTAETYRKKEDYDNVIAVLRPAAAKSDGTLDANGEFGVLYTLGFALSRKREFAEARTVFLRATTGQASLKDRADAYFNLACVEAGLIARVPAYEAQAVAHLKEALKLGEPGQFRSDFSHEDLVPLRGNPDFRKLAELAKKGLK